MQTPKNNKATDKGSVGEELIKHMVGRFLGWKIPQDFNPDAGISFKAEYGENGPYPGKHEPVGTNLLDAVQAEEMVRYMLEDFNFEAEATTPSLSEGKLVEEFYQHMLKSTPVLDSFERASLKLKVISILSQTREEERERMVAIGEELRKDEEYIPVPKGENIGEYRHCEKLKRQGENTAITAYQQKIKSLKNNL